MTLKPITLFVDELGNQYTSPEEYIKEKRIQIIQKHFRPFGAPSNETILDILMNRRSILEELDTVGKETH